MNKRTEYLERLSAQMVEWDNQIDRLKDKAKSASGGSGTDYSGAIAELELKRDEAAQKLQAISSTGDDQWEELKEGTDLVWGEVSSILRAAITKIK
jgi:hypothetical protein